MICSNNPYREAGNQATIAKNETLERTHQDHPRIHDETKN